jgi:hypothetical protein
MISVNSLGYTCLSTSPKFFINFKNSNAWLNDCLIVKFMLCKLIWGGGGRGEYQKLNSFFYKIDNSHHVSCPYAHQQNGFVERKHRHIFEVGLSPI